MQVRASGNQQSAFYDDMVKAQEHAESKGLGLHTKDASAQAAAVRDTMGADGARRAAGRESALA